MATRIEQLAEARSVYHDWRLGKVARSYTDANGEKVEYSLEGLRGLTAYIADLQRDIDLAAGRASSGRPMRVFF